MPIFCIKSVKIYTGQKNLHWRRQPRQRQLSGMEENGPDIFIVWTRYCTRSPLNIILTSLNCQFCNLLKCSPRRSNTSECQFHIMIKSTLTAATDPVRWGNAIKLSLVKMCEVEKVKVGLNCHALENQDLTFSNSWAYIISTVACKDVTSI